MPALHRLVADRDGRGADLRRMAKRIERDRRDGVRRCDFGPFWIREPDRSATGVVGAGDTGRGEKASQGERTAADGSVGHVRPPTSSGVPIRVAPEFRRVSADEMASAYLAGKESKGSTRVDLGWIRAFVEIAHAGGHTEVAARFNVTRPAVSHQIRWAEAEFGCALVTTHGRGIELAEDGRAPVDALGRSVEKFGALAVEMRRGRRNGRMRPFADYAPFSLWLIPRLDDYRRGVDAPGSSRRRAGRAWARSGALRHLKRTVRHRPGNTGRPSAR